MPNPPQEPPDYTAFEGITEVGVLSPASFRVSAEQSGTSGWYTRYLIESYYDWDSGIYPAAVGAQAGPTSMQQLHAPREVHVIAWTAERVGGKPTLPHWDTGNANEFLIKRRIYPSCPARALDGNQIWRAAGVYTYALVAPIGDGATFFTGATPDTTYTPEELMLGQELFSREILRSAPINVQQFVSAPGDILSG